MVLSKIVNRKVNSKESPHIGPRLRVLEIQKNYRLNEDRSGD